MNDVYIEGVYLNGEPITLEMLKFQIEREPEKVVLTDIDGTAMYFETEE